jgi:Cysteine rich repeat
MNRIDHFGRMLDPAGCQCGSASKIEVGFNRAARQSLGGWSMPKIALTIAMVLLLSTSSAMAQQRAVMKACATDIKAQCEEVQPGEGRIRACVKEHFTDFSEPCQVVLVKAAAVGKACAADVKQNCAGVKPGGGRIEACMKSHLADLSESCQDALTEAAAGKN